MLDLWEMAWDEDLHPRDEHGRFTDTGGGGEVTKEDRLAIKQYASSGYAKMNSDLRRGEPLNKVSGAPEMLAALSKIPAAPGKSYRGEWYFSKDLASSTVDKLTPGKVITCREFMSTSQDQKVSERMLTRGKAGITYSVDGQSGKSIQNISPLPGEKEVIFTPGTRFKVESVNWTQKELPTFAGGRMGRRSIPVARVHLSEVVRTKKVLKVDWDESKHPRVPAGSPTGGEFGLDTSGWKQVGSQRGSNPGGLYQSPSGDKYYCKFYRHPDQGRSEKVAQEAYRQAGCWAPTGHMVNLSGKTALANEWEGKMTGFQEESMREAVVSQPEQAGRLFGASVVCQNWDVVGLEYDNLVSVGDRLGCVDTGGSFLFRAQGAPKPFTQDAKEIRGLTDASVNPQSAEIFRGMLKDPKFASGAHEAVKTLREWFKEAPGVSQKEFQGKCDAVSKAIEKWPGFKKSVLDELWKQNWDPEKHPRGMHGQFVTSGGYSEEEHTQARVELPEVPKEEEPVVDEEYRTGRVALVAYLGDGYEEINQDLRAGHDITSVDDCKQLIQYMSTLEPYRGTVYRGEQYSSELKIPFQLKTGTVITAPAFFSTSKSRGVAETFAGRDVSPYSVQYEIESRTGKDVGRGKEKEVLYPPKTRFEITSVKISSSVEEAGYRGEPTELTLVNVKMREVERSG